MMSDDSSTSEDCQDLENLHTKIEKKFDDLEVVAD